MSRGACRKDKQFAGMFLSGQANGIQGQENQVDERSLKWNKSSENACVGNVV